MRAGIRGVVAAMIALAATPESVVTAQKAVSRIETLQMDSRALAGNLLKVPSRQRVEVYLPVTDASSGALPTIYLLHGIGGTSADWTRDDAIRARLDAAIAAGLIPPTVVVMPTAMTPYGGSMYVDSPLSGGWDTFIASELVPAVELRFPVASTAAMRGIAGHSMGGFGAIVLAMKHADVFGSVYAMSPCCLTLEGDLSPSNPVWRQLSTAKDVMALVAEAKRGNVYPISMVALGAAFSPNAERPPFLVDLPFAVVDGQVVPHEPAFGAWQRAMPMGSAASFAANLKQLRGIAMDYGLRDQFSHIPIGTQRFSAELARLGVPHLLDVHDGDHRDRLWSRLESRVLPFFGRVFRER